MGSGNSDHEKLPWGKGILNYSRLDTSYIVVTGLIVVSTWCIKNHAIEINAIVLICPGNMFCDTKTTSTPYCFLEHHDGRFENSWWRAEVWEWVSTETERYELQWQDQRAHRKIHSRNGGSENQKPGQ